MRIKRATSRVGYRGQVNRETTAHDSILIGVNTILFGIKEEII